MIAFHSGDPTAVVIEGLLVLGSAYSPYVLEIINSVQEVT